MIERYQAESAISYGSKMLFENLPELMKPQKAAGVLGISVKTIYDWKYRGQTRNIPSDLFIKINRSLYIRTDALRRWVISNN
mgnify:CR=1 FL=1